MPLQQRGNQRCDRLVNAAGRADCGTCRAIRERLRRDLPLILLAVDGRKANRDRRLVQIAEAVCGSLHLVLKRIAVVCEEVVVDVPTRGWKLRIVRPKRYPRQLVVIGSL